MKRITLLLILVLASGCASMGTGGDDGRIVGIVDKRTASTRFEEPSNALFALGVTGLLVRENVRNQGVPVFHYVIKTPEGDVTAEVGEVYAIGDCVEVYGKPANGSPRKFGWGEANMTRSSQCDYRSAAKR